MFKSFPTFARERLQTIVTNGADNNARDDFAIIDDDACAGPLGETAAERRARRRRTRWMGSEHDKTFIPGLPTVLPSTLTRDQEEQYLCEYRAPHPTVLCYRALKLTCLFR